VIIKHISSFRNTAKGDYRQPKCEVIFGSGLSGSGTAYDK